MTDEPASGPRRGTLHTGGVAGAAARRLALRLMRPHTAHQATVDRDLVDALQAIARDVDALSERALGTEAVALRGLRDVGDRLRSSVEPELTAGDARIDELAGTVDELRGTLERQGLLGLPADAATGFASGPYPTAPSEPWSDDYVAAHAAFVGHEVLMPSFAFAASAQAATWNGLRPVFVDVGEDDWHLDPGELERVLRKRRDRVAAVVALSSFGTPPSGGGSRTKGAACADAGVPLVIDSAAGFGAVGGDGRAIGAQDDAGLWPRLERAAATRDPGRAAILSCAPATRGAAGSRAGSSSA